MQFDPGNHVVRLCLRGMEMEEKGKAEEARGLFLLAWSDAASALEKFLAAYYVARVQTHAADKLRWTETALKYALEVNDSSTLSALPALYSTLADCYKEMGDGENAGRNLELASSAGKQAGDRGPFYHGTRADLQTGDLLKPGFGSNYKTGLQMNHIYFTALVNGAGLAAALATGEGRERVYIVEPTGDFENDPNVTDKKFPGNPTRSYRTKDPLMIIGEITDWVRQTPEQIRAWREKLANVKGDIIN